MIGAARARRRAGGPLEPRADRTAERLVPRVRGRAGEHRAEPARPDVDVVVEEAQEVASRGVDRRVAGHVEAARRPSATYRAPWPRRAAPSPGRRRRPRRRRSPRRARRPGRRPTRAPPRGTRGGRGSGSGSTRRALTAPMSLDARCTPRGRFRRARRDRRTCGRSRRPRRAQPSRSASPKHARVRRRRRVPQHEATRVAGKPSSRSLWPARSATKPSVGSGVRP